MTLAKPDPGGRVAGMAQGAVDVVQGNGHKARTGGREHQDHGREAATQARWEAGQPARNQFERDHYAEIEAKVTGGMRQLQAAGERATAMEAAMTVQAQREAGE